jgi:ketosteroid isomerase-like protein
MTQQEQNKEIGRRYVDALNRGDLEGLRALFPEEAVRA